VNSLQSSVDDSHDWHLFDVGRGIEVSHSAGYWNVRYKENPGHITLLNDQEFEQLRAEGSNPKGLD
jgi:hypothetical protein